MDTQKPIYDTITEIEQTRVSLTSLDNQLGAASSSWLESLSEHLERETDEASLNGIIDKLSSTVKSLLPVSGTPKVNKLFGNVLSLILQAELAIPENVRLDSLIALAASLATSGRVSLFHVAGVTPEANTVKEAFGGNIPSDEIIVESKEIEKAYQTLTTAKTNQIDFVTFSDKREQDRIISSIDIKPIDLSEKEVDQLVSFLESLTEKSGNQRPLGKPEKVPSGLTID